MNIREMLQAVPDSYEDFIDFTAAWMEKDDKVKNAVLDLLANKLEANSGDVLEVLSNCIGIGAPLELIDDEESFAGTAVA